MKLCGALDAPGRDVDGEIDQLLQSVASPKREPSTADTAAPSPGVLHNRTRAVSRVT